MLQSEPTKFAVLAAHAMSLAARIKLPAPVAAIYRAVAALEAAYPGRKFTPDGHLVGSIGEVVAAEALGLTLYRGSHPIHDAYDETGMCPAGLARREHIPSLGGPIRRAIAAFHLRRDF
jgi:hypothetical protein